MPECTTKPMGAASPVGRLVPLELPRFDPVRVPGDIEDMIAAAEAFRERFFADASSPRIPAFVASNPRIAYCALRHIVEHRLASGTRFCEWGSGLGIATCLAARLGFDAIGIEIEPRLIAQSRRFAAAFAPAARFIEGSYQPDGLFDETIRAELLDRKLGFSPTDFDVVYMFPWPAEERVATRLFTQFGRNGALLLSFHGGASIQLRRRVSR